jgi:Uncharacterized protein involved in cytokinesis, contains TGc (transglutaminase/protease-like) domain
LTVVALVLLMSAVWSVPAYAEQGPLTIRLNGEKIDARDAVPFIDKNGRTQVPVRFVSEAFGAQVKWNSKDKTIEIKDVLQGKRIVFRLGEQEYWVDTKKLKMDTVPVVKQGRTYVPARYIAEALGATVKYDKAAHIVDMRAEFQMPQRVALTLNGTILLENQFYDLDPLPAAWPNVYESVYLVPIEPLARIFHGKYDFDAESGRAKLVLDGTSFEFEAYSKKAKINGKPVTLPYEVRLEHGFVKVPGRVFEGALPTYDAIVFEERAMIFREKGKVDFVDKDGRKIGLSGIYEPEKWAEIVRKNEGDPLIQKVDALTDAIVAEIAKPGMTDYEKVLAINEYMVEHVEYDWDYTGYYDALLYGKAICDGFTHSTGILLEKMGVKWKYVSGYAGVNGYGDIDGYELLGYGKNAHAWNLVEIDGQYYHLDTTWNEGGINNREFTGDEYNYFLLTDEQIAKDHIWRKGFVPQSSVKDFAPETLRKLEAQGYPLLKGSVKLNGGAAAEDVLIEIMAESKGGDKLDFRRVIRIPRGESGASFAMAIGKRFKDVELAVQARAVELNKYGTYQLSEKYEITGTGEADRFAFAVERKAVNAVQGRMIVPAGLAIDEELDFIVVLRIYTAIPTGHVLYGDVPFRTQGSLKPGEREAAFDINRMVPDGAYSYSVEYVFNERYAGETKVQYPVKHSGWADENGNEAPEGYLIDGTRYPLEQIVIRLQTNPEWKPEDVSGGKVQISEAVKKEIADLLKEHHAGDHDKLRKLKSLSDAKALEKSAPNETDRNGTIYYSGQSVSGIEVFRSYSEIDLPGPHLSYRISFNRLHITESNYLDTLKVVNDYLQSALGAKTAADVFVIRDGSREKLAELRSRDQLFEQIEKGYAQLMLSYKKDNVTYTASLYGFPYDKSVSVSVTARIDL